MPRTDSLRNLPAVDEVLRDPRLADAIATLPQSLLVEWIRNSVEECRQSILSGRHLDAEAAVQSVAEGVLSQQRREEGSRQQPVINATGILLHTNLGRSPLADRAVLQMQRAAGYSNVEMDLLSGRRNQRADRVCRLLARLTGAEDAVIVNNCAAATMLVLQTMAAGREVIVSRGQLVEIGGGFRLPEVFASSGAILKEVGTTNRTYLRDYEAAISENTAAIIRVHRSNFFQGGFVTEPDISDLVSLGRERNIPVIDDIGSGCVSDSRAFGLTEPSVQDSVAAGADVTLFSGDKLFGGPQAGIIVGRATFAEQFRRNPMMRALRLDKVTIAAIEATTEIHLSKTAAEELPLWMMLAKDADDIRQTCESVLSRLSIPASLKISVCDSISQVGGGSVPGSEIASCAIRVQTSDADQFSELLRTAKVPVLARISDDAVMIDLRTVADTQLDSLSQTIQHALNSTAGQA